MAVERKRQVDVCVLDKGADIGAHVMSGCVMDPRALDELLPEWRDGERPALMTEAKMDRLYFLTEERSLRLPVVPQLKNKGCYIVSLR